MKQARDELCIRLCDRLFDADGSKNKWWQVSDIFSVVSEFSSLVPMCDYFSLFQRRDLWEKNLRISWSLTIDLFHS
jgi:hypothetical protein